MDDRILIVRKFFEKKMAEKSRG